MPMEHKPRVCAPFFYSCNPIPTVNDSAEAYTVFIDTGKEDPHAVDKFFAGWAVDNCPDWRN